MEEKAYVVWDRPGRSSCLSTVECSSSDLPVEIGTRVRCGDFLGIVIEGREHKGLPIYPGSVRIECTHSIVKNTDLTAKHVWYVPSCQILTGTLLQAALDDPCGLLHKFRNIEDQIYKERSLRKVPPRKKK